MAHIPEELERMIYETENRVDTNDLILINDEQFFQLAVIVSKDPMGNIFFRLPEYPLLICTHQSDPNITVLEKHFEFLNLQSQ